MGARWPFQPGQQCGLRCGRFEHQLIADLLELLEVNLIGAVVTTKAFIPLLRQGKGRIINIGLISGLKVRPARSRVATAPRSLPWRRSATLCGWNCDRGESRVSVVEPGNIETPIWQKGLEAGDKMLAAWPPRAF